MTSDGPVLQSGTFVDGKAGQRFRLVSRPASDADAGTIVFVHAFAEEMNKSRRMVARMARALAACGWTVVQTDLFGCGDSAGEFRDATWDIWCADLADEVARVEHERPLWLWSLRAGSLLASTALAVRPDLHLLLWQPVLSGAQHLQQFLRLHAGARIAGSGKDSAGPTPAQRLRAGEQVEVAGYEISPALAHGIAAARLERRAGCTGRTVWLELSALDPPTLSVPSFECITRWRDSGAEVDARALSGPALWQTQEIEESDALLQATLQAFACAAPARSLPPPRTAGAPA